MYEQMTVSELARGLSKRLGSAIPPRAVSDLFYRRLLSDERCPIVAGRRMIPRDYVPEVERVLREQGIITG